MSQDEEQDAQDAPTPPPGAAHGSTCALSDFIGQAPAELMPGAGSGAGGAAPVKGQGKGRGQAGGKALSELSGQALARWKEDSATLHQSWHLLFTNKFEEAVQVLDDAVKRADAREIDKSTGEHDGRGHFAFLKALVGMLAGLANLQDNQFDTVLSGIRVADELLQQDNDWVGKSLTRGLCMVMGGLINIMQGAIPRGVWSVLRSWSYLRNLETEALEYQGPEREVVRSTALLALGVFNLLTSALPPSAMHVAGWATGFKGGRERALDQLLLSWKEQGINAPTSALVYLGYAFDISSFLGELGPRRRERFQKAREILEVADEKYPGSFFFGALGGLQSACSKDLASAVSKFMSLEDTVKDKPAFLFVCKFRLSQMLLCSMRWAEAAEAFLAAVEVHRSVGRRAGCPLFAMNAYLCWTAAGEADKACSALELALSYSKETKKWSLLDKSSLQQAKGIALTLPEDSTSFLAAQSDGSPVAGGSKEKGKKEKEKEPTFAWVPRRPLLLLYAKICVWMRGAQFMSDEQLQKFLALVDSETEAAAAKNDADAQAMGLGVRAEALRQSESWDDAIKAASECLALAPSLSNDVRCTGILQFSQLAIAYAQYGKGQPGAAKDALMQLDALGKDVLWKTQVDFKAQHLKQLIGVELQDSYTEVVVGARSKAKLVVDLPEGIALVEWDWVVAEHNISFEAGFFPAGASADSSTVLLQTVAKHESDAGPCVGSFEPPGPGKLELVWDNTFSKLRSKKVQCRVQPDSLKAVRDQSFK